MRTHKAGSKVCSEATIVFDLRPGQNAGKLRFIVRTFVPTTMFFVLFFITIIFSIARTFVPTTMSFVFCFIIFYIFVPTTMWMAVLEDVLLAYGAAVKDNGSLCLER